MTQLPSVWHHEIQMLTAYLEHLWELPNYDCWEEFPDKVHIATLCAPYGAFEAVERHTASRTAAEHAQAAYRLPRGATHCMG